MPLLMSKLQRDLKGFRVEQDSKNPKIVHIIEEKLEQDKNYILDKKIDLTYSGNLEHCHVKDINGNEFSKGIGVVDSLAQKIGGVQKGQKNLAPSSLILTVILWLTSMPRMRP